MRRLYTLALYLGVPWVLLYLLWRGLFQPAYWRGIGERFGGPPPGPRGPVDVWLHAVSVGEAQAAVPLVRGLLGRDPDLRILVTSTTPTGAERVRETLGASVSRAYAPYDLPFALARLLGRARPRLAIVMETELWPNTFHQCAVRDIPLVLANARLSARSARGYRRAAPLVGAMLREVSLVAAQSQGDAERLVSLGAPPERVRVTGNVKFDIPAPASLREQAQVLRRQWGVDRGVWIAASTHAGEDEPVLKAHARVLEALPGSLLVLVSRHPERFSGVAALARRHGFRTGRRTEEAGADRALEVVVGDTMGELGLFYAASDVAFVGGSLVPRGGQNLLEPAALGRPVLVGPHLFNFSDSAERLLERGAACKVEGAATLADAVIALLRDANLRHAMGEEGRRVVRENRGAAERLVDLIEARLRTARGPTPRGGDNA